MSRDGAIGVFDSGVGGLTVLHEIVKALPHEEEIYFGDTGRYPYGTKSAETITRFSLENVEFLAGRGIKLLVVACNSVSAVALDAIRARFPIPVIGVIEPGARAAAARTRSGRVGVIGTEATIASGAYSTALRALRPSLEMYVRACPLFVPLAEEGWIDGPIARQVAETYLASLARSGIDTLILGCTHYPLLTGVISYVMGDQVTLVSSAEECAKDVYKMLAGTGLMRPGGEASYTFSTTGSPDDFATIGRRFLGSELLGATQFAGGRG
jgi:glutamate racemase